MERLKEVLSPPIRLLVTKGSYNPHHSICFEAVELLFVCSTGNGTVTTSAQANGRTGGSYHEEELRDLLEGVRSEMGQKSGSPNEVRREVCLDLLKHLGGASTLAQHSKESTWIQ